MVRERVSPNTCQTFCDKMHLSYKVHLSNDPLQNFNENFIKGIDEKMTFKLKPLDHV